MTCVCDGCKVRRLVNENAVEGLDANDVEDAQRTRCFICNVKLIIPGGFHGIGMCGPCVTGDASTADEVE